MITEEKKKTSGCLKIFLIILGLFVVLLVGAGILIYQKGSEFARSTTSTAIVSGAEALLKDAQFPEDEKQRILAPLQQFADGIKSGEVSMTASVTGIATLAQRGLPLFLLRILEVAHLELSTLTPDEKAAARQTIQRLQTAVASGKIDAEQFNALSQSVAETSDGDINVALKDTLTDADFRAFLSNASAAADAAGIPAEVPPIDYAEAIANAIAEGVQQAEAGM